MADENKDETQEDKERECNLLVDGAWLTVKNRKEAELTGWFECDLKVGESYTECRIDGNKIAAEYYSDEEGEADDEPKVTVTSKNKNKSY
jgi:hypothetical protein